MNKAIILLFLSIFISSCYSQKSPSASIIPGAEQLHLYLPHLQDQKVGIVANHTSRVKNTHLVDTLLNLNVYIEKIFALEHGFRGDADAGQMLDDQTDSKTGIPIVSLYGKDKKPTKNDLKDIDILIFDIQDVGVRFYTYLSSLHYVLEAAAENNIPLLLLDRPNPNGFYVAGPLLDTVNSSFVGIHPIPIVHGMTLGELAKMIEGESWINKADSLELIVIKTKNYTHDSLLTLNVNPSPNLQSMKAIYLYPTLGLFEGTIMSVGRGTDFPFLVFGHPDFVGGNITFKPRSIPGVSRYPKYKGKECHGINLRDYSVEYLLNQPQIHLEWVILAYERMGKPDDFFNAFFLNLVGTDMVKEYIKTGWSADKIRSLWKQEVETFKLKRKKYLLYEDFE